MNTLTTIVFCMVCLASGQVVTLKPLSVHILDTAFGGNAPNVTCKLYKESPSNTQKFRLIATAVTNADGRISAFLSAENYEFGTYRIWFGVGDYFQYSHGVSTFFPNSQITFENTDGTFTHIPLIVSPYSVGTYRGS